MEDGIQPPHRVQAKQRIATNIADFRGHMINDYDLPTYPHGVRDLTFLITSRAACKATVHDALLWVGAVHFGGKGSYTVMIINVAWAVVQTRCRGRPCPLWP